MTLHLWPDCGLSGQLRGQLLKWCDEIERVWDSLCGLLCLGCWYLQLRAALAASEGSITALRILGGMFSQNLLPSQERLAEKKTQDSAEDRVTACAVQQLPQASRDALVAASLFVNEFSPIALDEVGLVSTRLAVRWSLTFGSVVLFSNSWVCFGTRS